MCKTSKCVIRVTNKVRAKLAKNKFPFSIVDDMDSLMDKDSFLDNKRIRHDRDSNINYRQYFTVDKFCSIR